MKVRIIMCASSERRGNEDQGTRKGTGGAWEQMTSKRGKEEEEWIP